MEDVEISSEAKKRMGFRPTRESCKTCMYESDGKCVYNPSFPFSVHTNSICDEYGVRYDTADQDN